MYDCHKSIFRVCSQDEKTIKTRLYGLQELTFTIKDGIDYIVSLLERVKK